MQLVPKVWSYLLRLRSNITSSGQVLSGSTVSDSDAMSGIVQDQSRVSYSNIENDIKVSNNSSISSSFISANISNSSIAGCVVSVPITGYICSCPSDDNSISSGQDIEEKCSPK